MAQSTLRNLPSIVEQGTSGIWTYRKWSDGTAECWGEYSKAVSARSTDVDNFIQFPFSFTVTPTVVSSVVAGGADYYRGHVESITTARVRLILINNYTSQVGMGMSLYAIGKWK